MGAVTLAVEPPVRRSACRYHCRRCRRHFASLGAFDRHLAWLEREGRERRRICESPTVVLKLRAQSDDGVCNILAHEDGVTVWEEGRKALPRVARRRARA